MSPIPTNVPGKVLESPLHYPTLAAPVELSTVYSVLISPNRVRDAYPIFELSPDKTGLVQATVPGGSASSAVSLPQTGRSLFLR